MITKDAGGTILRNFEKPNERKFRAQHAAFPVGTTPILKQAGLAWLSMAKLKFRC